MYQYLNCIKNALAKFYRNDITLLDSNRKTHEQTVSFRLAHYLSERLEIQDLGLFVDCEYHGDKNNPRFRKEIAVNGQTERIRPDIIYHNRYRDNKFCVEVKLGSPRSDILKVKTFMQAYDYKEGYCLCNVGQSRCTLICFKKSSKARKIVLLWKGNHFEEIEK